MRLHDLMDSELEVDSASVSISEKQEEPCPKTTSQVKADRFIPLRRNDLAQETDNSQLQYEHEQSVLRFQT